jgi:hypothetical protein
MNAGQQRLQNGFSAHAAQCDPSYELHPEKDPPPMTRIALVALALAATTTAASAGDLARRERIDAREAAQTRRIEYNRRAGELTWYETVKLKAEQRRIHQMEAWAKRDGYISRDEARRIEAAQDAASRHIYRESHDGQTAWRRRVW